MIRYEGQLYRPPSEANSLILQATIGCSYNDCSFCGMYRDKRFRVRPYDELCDEIDRMRALPDSQNLIRKVFLADGDALIAKPAFLAKLCDRLNEAFPNLRRISCYASPQSLQVRTVEQMAMLREKGLTLYYLGIESGDDAALEFLVKGVDSDELARVANKATEAGVALSTMILLGAGGRARSREHALASAEIVNRIQPRFVSTLVMTPVEGTPLMEQSERGEIDDLSPVELAVELRAFLGALAVSSSIFRSNHASNTLTLSGTLPKDQPRMLKALDRVLADPENAPFVPNWMRAL